MTYDPATPQASDLPSDSQDEILTNFELLNQFFGVDHVPFSNIVSFATNANPCVCTSASHGLTTSNTVRIAHFSSLVGDVIEPWDINSGGPYTVTVIDDNTFSINADASADGAYLANSGAFSCAQFNYGFHTKTFFPNVLPEGPNNDPPLGSPYSAYYTKTLEYKNTKTTQLYFQNGVGTSFETLLTNLPLIRGVTNFGGQGITTPWGVKINFGWLSISKTIQTFSLKVPFSSQFWTIIGTLFGASDGSQLVIAEQDLSHFTAYFASPDSRKVAQIYYIALGV